MEEKKIIIDVTWKTAFSIWWKFTVISAVFALIVSLIVLYSIQAKENNNFRVSNESNSFNVEKKQSYSDSDMQKGYKRCIQINIETLKKTEEQAELNCQHLKP